MSILTPRIRFRVFNLKCWAFILGVSLTQWAISQERPVSAIESIKTVNWCSDVGDLRNHGELLTNAMHHSTDTEEDTEEESENTPSVTVEYLAYTKRGCPSGSEYNNSKIYTNESTINKLCTNNTIKAYKTRVNFGNSKTPWGRCTPCYGRIPFIEESHEHDEPFLVSSLMYKVSFNSEREHIISQSRMLAIRSRRVLASV